MCRFDFDTLIKVLETQCDGAEYFLVMISNLIHFSSAKCCVF